MNWFTSITSHLLVSRPFTRRCPHEIPAEAPAECCKAEIGRATPLACRFSYWVGCSKLQIEPQIVNTTWGHKIWGTKLKWRIEVRTFSKPVECFGQKVRSSREEKFCWQQYNNNFTWRLGVTACLFCVKTDFPMRLWVESFWGWGLWVRSLASVVDEPIRDLPAWLTSEPSTPNSGFSDISP